MRSAGNTPNRPAWLATWWLTRSTALTQAQVARLLGVSRPRVSQITRRLMVLAMEDEELRARMAKLEEGWREA